MKNKKPLAVEHKGLVKAKRKAGGLRVQIYGKFRTYTTIKNNIRGVQL